MSLNMPLRYSIPAIIFFLALAIIPASLYSLLPTIERHQEAFLQEEARVFIVRLQRVLAHHLERQDYAAAEQELQFSADTEHVLQLQFVDSQRGEPYCQSTDARLGNPTAAQNIPFKWLQEAEKTREIVYFYKGDEAALYALSAFVPAIGSMAGVVGDERQGTLVLKLSAEGVRKGIRDEVEVLVYALLIATVLLSGILILVLNRAVTSKITRLIAATKAFAEGDQHAYKPCIGRGEFGVLATAFDDMAAKLDGIHHQLRASAYLMDELLENSPSMIVIRDTHGRYLRANPAYLEFFGLTNEHDLIATSPREHLPPPLAESAIEGDRQVIDTQQPFSWERHYDFNGRSYLLYSERFPLFDENGELYAVCTLATDRTERAQREKELRLARYVFETTNDGIIVTDAHNRILDANPSFERVTGYGRDEVIGRPPNLLNSFRQTPEFYENMWEKIDSTGGWSGEIWNRKKSGEIYPEWLTVKAMEDEHGEVSGYFGVFTDITEQKKTEDSLRNLAYYDSLTNLANRTLCQERLAHDMELSCRHREALALVFIDLDFFKHVNDSLGHEYGDQLLVEAAARIQGEVRVSDTVARWGGDEFILILPGIYQENMALVIASNVLDALKKPFRLKGSDVYIGASIGIAVYPNDAEDAETLIKHADAAMYSAKSKGRDQICFFDPELNQKNLELIQLKADMRQALKLEQFEVYFQPKVCIKTNAIIGFEALLRWQYEEGHWISPAEFIPVAERSGLIVQIGHWVLATVCTQVDTWLNAGVLQPGMRVSVNLSPKQLAHKDLIDQIDEQFEQYPQLNQHLSVEITETAVIENIQKTLPIIEQMRSRGVQIELDDFGSGYSSLNYLRRLPVDVLKVDKSFISELDQNASERAIMQSIINMAHSLNMSVVAEGVESEQQLGILRDFDCDFAQGFYYAKPQTIEEITRLLENGLVLENAINKVLEEVN